MVRDTLEHEDCTLRSFLFVLTGFSKHNGVRVHSRYGMKYVGLQRHNVALSHLDIKQILIQSRYIDYVIKYTKTIEDTLWRNDISLNIVDSTYRM